MNDTKLQQVLATFVWKRAGGRRNTIYHILIVTNINFVGKENHSTRRKMILTIFYHHQAKRGASKDADFLLSLSSQQPGVWGMICLIYLWRLWARAIHHNYGTGVRWWTLGTSLSLEIQSPVLLSDHNIDTMVNIPFLWITGKHVTDVTILML